MVTNSDLAHEGQLGLFGPQGPTARARSTDPQTSHDAAASISSESITERQDHVLRCLIYYGPMTDGEIMVAYENSGRPGQSPSGLRTRRSELVELRLVEDSGERKQTAAGRKTIVWQAVGA